MTTTVAALALQLNGEVRGDAELVIEGAEALHKAGPHDVTFVADEQNVRRLNKLTSCRAGAVIVGRELVSLLAEGLAVGAVIVVENAAAAFSTVLQQFRPQRQRPALGISPDAFISPTACIGENCNVYPGAYIGDEVVVGDNCDIFSGVSIGDGCRVGNNVVLHPNVVLYPDVHIADRVIIHASAVIGADGFGYRFEEGRFIKIPQLGTVHIQEDVEIGACTTVDRGMIGPTVIGAGTKLDNLVMIAHNCELGKHNAFASQVGLAGSVTTGDYVRCAGQVGIRDHVHLGEGSVLGAKAGVHKDIPVGQSYLGIPATPEAEQIKNVMAIRKLPDMRKQLRQLESRVAELTEQLQKLLEQGPEPKESTAA